MIAEWLLGTNNWYQSLHLIILRVKSSGFLKTEELLTGFLGNLHRGVFQRYLVHLCLSPNVFRHLEQTQYWVWLIWSFLRYSGLIFGVPDSVFPIHSYRAPEPDTYPIPIHSYRAPEPDTYPIPIHSYRAPEPDTYRTPDPDTHRAPDPSFRNFS